MVFIQKYYTYIHALIQGMVDIWGYHMPIFQPDIGANTHISIPQKQLVPRYNT